MAPVVSDSFENWRESLPFVKEYRKVGSLYVAYKKLNGEWPKLLPVIMMKVYIEATNDEDLDARLSKIPFHLCSF